MSFNCIFVLLAWLSPTRRILQIHLIFIKFQVKVFVSREINLYMLSVQNLHFSYKKKHIFTQLSFDLTPDSVVGLLGKNGSGKTTLLKIIAGLLFPHQGQVRLDGWPAKRNASFLEKVYFLPEKFTLPQIRVGELNNYGRFYPHFNKEEFFSFLDYLELSPTPPMTTLSFGQGKKAFIAFALATQCPLVMLDEPTNGLDIPSKPRFKKLIIEVGQNKNSSIIISSHQAADLQDIISRVMVLDEGQIIFHQEVANILQELFFSLATKKPNPSNNLILTLEAVTGYSALYKNTEKRPSKLNLEILFQGLLEKREVIDEFFKTKSQ